MTAGADDSGAGLAPGEPTAPFAETGSSQDPAAGGANPAAPATPAAPAVQTADGKPIDLRPRLLKSGWAQGAVLPRELVPHVRMSPGSDAPPAAGWPKGSWLVLVSQDCDIVYGDCVADPVAEVVLATKIEKPEMQYEHLRDPRKLHVALTHDDGTPQPVVVEARNRGFLDRVLLLTAPPESAIRADSGAMRRIAGLLSRRYQRTARPEEFDQRFKSAKGKLGRILQQYAAVVLDILLFVDPLTDLPEGTAAYTAQLWVVLQDDFADRDPKKTQGQKTQILGEIRRAVQNSKGINFDAPRLEGRYGISLREYDDLQPLDLGWPRLAAEAGTEATASDAQTEGAAGGSPAAAPPRTE